MKTASKVSGAIILIFLALISSAVFIWPVQAAGIVVNTAADEDTNNTDCSLREAIIAANTNSAYNGCNPGASADFISFAADFAITLGSPLPAVADYLTIDGAGHSVTVSGADQYQVMFVNSGETLYLARITIANGKAGAGGGVYNNGSLNVIEVEFSNNRAAGGGYGGGIYNAGTLNVTDSVFSGNWMETTAGDTYGGGIYNGPTATATVTGSVFNGNWAASGFGGGIYNDGTLTLANDTFYNNGAGDNGGNLYQNDGSLSVINTTFSHGHAVIGASLYVNGGTVVIQNAILANRQSGAEDCYKAGGTVSGDHNLIETDGAGVNACGTTSPINNLDPNLGPLADNGGPTQTMALLYPSPAIDAGNDSVCAAFPVNNLDQRGVARPKRAHCDIGAYELEEGTQSGPDFVVNTDADGDDGFCDLPGQGVGNQDCSLREAIHAANAHGGADTITFAADYIITLG
ncbi:MAG: CSLREA domain-containing protein, partial [Chloroflexota bacterium]